MPITLNDAPTSLPEEARELYVSAFNETDDDGLAWKAVERSFQKEGEAWVRRADLSHFNFVITKASVDQESGEKRWACVASDTEKDQLNDEMHKSLFDSFLHKIKADVQVPPPWQSDYWKGGTPYLSLSHYSDANGKAVPGDVESVYLDGSRLKAKGTFHENPLGEAAYRSVRESYQKMKSGSGDGEFKPVRISIGFLDYKHTHKSNGYVFERKSFTEICPECKKDFINELLGKERSGVVYQDGQLIHLALTREPVNQRTIIGLDTEVTRSMTTRKEDAASIVGDELADEIEEVDALEAAMPEKSLVTKSEETAPVVEKSDRYYTMEAGMTSMERADAAYSINDTFNLLESVVWNITFYGDDEYPTAESMKSAVRTALDDASEMIVARGLMVMKNLNSDLEPELVPEVVEETALDKAYVALKSKIETVDKSSADNMKELGVEYEAFAQVIRSEFGDEGTVAEPEVVAETPSVDIAAEIQRALAPLTAEIATLKSQLAEKPQGEVRRGVIAPPLVVVNDPAKHEPAAPVQKASAFTRMINRTVGLPEDFVGRSGAKVE